MTAVFLRFITIALLVLPLWGKAQTSPPKMDKEHPFEVRILWAILDVDEINDADQTFAANIYMAIRWKDSRLASGSEGLRHVPINTIWHPNFVMPDLQKSWGEHPATLEVNGEGEVVYRRKLWGTFSEPLYLHSFPFDSQELNIRLVMTGFPAENIKFISEPSIPSGITPEPSIPNWEIVGSEIIHGGYMPYKAGSAQVASSLFKIKVKRKVGFFVLKIILPMVLIVAMSWMVFYIPVKDIGTRVSISVTTMLTLIAYRFMVDGLLPPISYLNKLDVSIFFSTLLVFFTLILAVIAPLTGGRDKQKSWVLKVNKMARWLFPMVFVLINIWGYFFY